MLSNSLIMDKIKDAQLQKKRLKSLIYSNQKRRKERKRTRKKNKEFNSNSVYHSFPLGKWASRKTFQWASDGMVWLHIVVKSGDRVKRSQSHQFLINTSIMGVNRRVILTGNVHGASLLCPSIPPQHVQKLHGCLLLHLAPFILTQTSVIWLRLWKWSLAWMTSCCP